MNYERLYNLVKEGDTYRKKYISDLYEEDFCVAFPQIGEYSVGEAIVPAIDIPVENPALCEYRVDKEGKIIFSVYQNFNKQLVEIQDAAWYTLLYRAARFAGREYEVNLSIGCDSELAERICYDLETFKNVDPEAFIDFVEYSYRDLDQE